MQRIASEIEAFSLSFSIKLFAPNGWFIGSGVIESGCKTIVCQRFKQSGMIWSLNGVKSLLPLRTLLMSNRLEEFFRYRKKHLEQVSFVS